MKQFDIRVAKDLFIPSPTSHKGDNGSVLVVGGSELFHAAGLWSCEIASKFVDLVYFASVPDNNELMKKSKERFANGIVVPRGEIGSYVVEADCILIGPGMVRAKKKSIQNRSKMLSLEEILSLKSEGAQTYWLTKYLLLSYPHKRFVLDAGALQMMEPDWLTELSEPAIITPHLREFVQLGGVDSVDVARADVEDAVVAFAKNHTCVVLLKDRVDIVCSTSECVEVVGGNAGMTKGGTGDVLAGLAAALYSKNDAFLSACVSSYVNKLAGDSLHTIVGPYFNASDLIGEIPHVFQEIVHAKG